MHCYSSLRMSRAACSVTLSTPCSVIACSPCTAPGTPTQPWTTPSPTPSPPLRCISFRFSAGLGLLCARLQREGKVCWYTAAPASTAAAASRALCLCLTAAPPSPSHSSALCASEQSASPPFGRCSKAKTSRAFSSKSAHMIGRSKLQKMLELPKCARASSCRLLLGFDQKQFASDVFVNPRPRPLQLQRERNSKCKRIKFISSREQPPRKKRHARCTVCSSHASGRIARSRLLSVRRPNYSVGGATVEFIFEQKLQSRRN